MPTLRPSRETIFSRKVRGGHAKSAKRDAGFVSLAGSGDYMLYVRIFSAIRLIFPVSFFGSASKKTRYFGILNFAKCFSQ
jgi:hypothetical protein